MRDAVCGSHKRGRPDAPSAAQRSSEAAARAATITRSAFVATLLGTPATLFLGADSVRAMGVMPAEIRAAVPIAPSTIAQATEKLELARRALAETASQSDVAQLEQFYLARGRGLQDFSSVGTLRQRQALKAALDELRADVVAEKARSRDLALGPPKCFTIGCYENR